MATKKVTKKATRRKKAPAKGNGAPRSKVKVPRRATAARKNGKPRASTQLEPLKLRGKMFLEYRAAMAELFESRATLKLAEEQLRIEGMKPEYRPLFKLQDERNDALRAVATRQTAFKQVQARVCAKFGIEMDELVHYTINEMSGAIVFTPPKDDAKAPAG